MESQKPRKRTKSRPRTKHDKNRVLLVEDHPIVLRGLAELLGEEPDLEICGEAGDGKEALNAVKKLQPDLAIIDLSLKDRSGLELIESLKAQHPQLVVLVLAMHDEFLYAERAIRAGASGYVMKETASESLLTAVRQVLRGEFYSSAKMSRTILCFSSRPA